MRGSAEPLLLADTLSWWICERIWICVLSRDLNVTSCSSNILLVKISKLSRVQNKLNIELMQIKACKIAKCAHSVYMYILV